MFVVFIWEISSNLCFARPSLPCNRGAFRWLRHWNWHGLKHRWNVPNITHSIHVGYIRYIYLHLADLYGKCRQILYHTWILWVMMVCCYLDYVVTLFCFCFFLHHIFKRLGLLGFFGGIYFMAIFKDIFSHRPKSWVVSFTRQNDEERTATHQQIPSSLCRAGVAGVYNSCGKGGANCENWRCFCTVLGGEHTGGDFILFTVWDWQTNIQGLIVVISYKYKPNL